MVIFNSYVSLAEGKSPKNLKITNDLEETNLPTPIDQGLC